MIQPLAIEKQATISIKRIFNLPIATLWKAFTEAESLKKWWGPKEYTCPDCIIDFKVGGKFLASMQGSDIRKLWSTGTYKEIIPLKRIVNTDKFSDSKGNVVPASYYKMPDHWGKDLMVSFEFEEVDGKTKLSMQHAGLPAEMSEECKKGWQSSLDKLETSLSSEW